MVLVKPAIAKAAETQIRRSFDQLDEQLWLIQKEYNKTKAAAKDQPPEETANMMNMYVQAVQKRLIELKEKSQEKSKDIKVLKVLLYYNVTNMRSISPTPRRPQSSPMFIFRAVSPPKSPNIARWLVKERNGVLPSSISAQPKQLLISQPPRRSLASRLTRTHALVSMTVRELQPPLEHMESKILVSVQEVLQLVIHHWIPAVTTVHHQTPVTMEVNSPLADSKRDHEVAVISPIRVTDISLEWPILRIRCERRLSKMISRVLKWGNTTLLGLNYLKIRFRWVRKILALHLRIHLVQSFNFKLFCFKKYTEFSIKGFEEGWVWSGWRWSNLEVLNVSFT